MKNREMKFRAFINDKQIDEHEMIELPFAALQYFDFEGSYALSFVVDGYSGFWGHEHYRDCKDAIIMKYLGKFFEPEQPVYESDILEFWLCYRTSQTHSGDNIPRGSYTEPDEPQLVKCTGWVFYNEDDARWNVCLINTPYQYNNAFMYIENRMPIIGRQDYYTREEVKDILIGYDASDADWQQMILDEGFANEDEMIKTINTVRVIGNIHQNPELLK